MEVNKIKIRCSKLGSLMTEPKSKADKEAGNLSETAKSVIDELFLEKEYGYKNHVYTEPILKGLLCEQDSMGLVQTVLGGEFRIKNKETFKDNFICGTPDIVLKKEDVIEDVKTSYDIKSFFNASLTDEYFWQGQGYMHLTCKKNYRLIYCLIDTPFEIVQEEQKRWFFKFGCDENNPQYKEICESIERNHSYKHIPIEKRIKIFDFKYEPAKIEMMLKKVEKAREYYQSLKL